MCVCVCPTAAPTWFLVDVGGEQPISSLLSIWTGEVELPKVGHVKDGHAVSAREALALNLNENTHTLTQTRTNECVRVCVKVIASEVTCSHFLLFHLQGTFLLL